MKVLPGWRRDQATCVALSSFLALFVFGCGRFGFELSEPDISQEQFTHSGGLDDQATLTLPVETLPPPEALEESPAPQCALGSDEHCAACNDSCSSVDAQVSNASLSCVSGSCELTSCVPGFDNCDGDPTNGCEGALDSTEHCGACNNGCSFANARASCDGTTCAMGPCDAGFGDCDGDPSNGCEVRLADANHCGACGASCAHDNGSSSCDSGSCELVQCDEGYDDCDGDASNGCETRLDELANCGSCGTLCDIAATTSESCGGGICTTASCTAPFADCDGDGLSCETNLNTLDDCGLCGSACGDTNGRLDNATATCATGSCQVDSCDSGWANCDASAVTGCETPTNTDTDCGGCNTPCSLPHAESSCGTGTCEIVTCDSGWDDCDAAPGCESDLNSEAHCGGCNIACEATESCVAGNCVPQFTTFTPSNFDPDTLPDESAPDLALNCGSITIDTTTLTSSGWCGVPAPSIVTRSQASGPELAIVTLRSLDVAAGTTIYATGSRPLVLAVFGDADIRGDIDVGAQIWQGGPGENWQCGSSNGTNGDGSSSFGGGGGGGGAFRADGGDGGYGDIFGNQGAGGEARGDDVLSPLIPGCRGGWGGGCGAGPGGGGGAVQVSVAGQLRVSGTLRSNGGDGVDGCGTEGGGSGGGSGGAVLLEGDQLVFTGSISAAGGRGGDGGSGGNGGSGSTTGAGQDGSSHITNGGGGGGGSAGRVRLRGASSCSTSGSSAPTASTSCP